MWSKQKRKVKKKHHVASLWLWRARTPTHFGFRNIRESVGSMRKCVCWLCCEYVKCSIFKFNFFPFFLTTHPVTMRWNCHDGDPSKWIFFFKEGRGRVSIFWITSHFFFFFADLELNLLLILTSCPFLNQSHVESHQYACCDPYISPPPSTFSSHRSSCVKGHSEKYDVEYPLQPHAFFCLFKL